MTRSGKTPGAGAGPGKKKGGPASKTANIGGARQLTVRVKTANKRKISSTRWLQRQLNDPYVAAAKRDGYRSRAAYKLLQMHEQHKLFKPGMKVVDLGAAPGGWAQVVSRLVKAGGSQRGQVIGIDITAMDPVAHVELLHLDFMDDAAPDQLKAALRGENADAVLSDMAAPSTGHKQTDHLRIMVLCEAAAQFASDVLTPGGFFLAKVLQGGTERALLDALKRDYAAVRHIKPEASRQDSAEAYVLATGFRGGAAARHPAD